MARSLIKKKFGEYVEGKKHGGVKEYEIKVKSNGDSVYDGNNKCKFRVDNILKVSSTLINKLKYGLAKDSLFNLQIRYLS